MDIRAERMTRMATIEIKMLGGFEIRVNGKPVLAQLAQSRKATALVQYLVLRRGERVSHKVLTDTLWAGERSTNPDMALRAILHRFRLMIDAEGLDEMKGCIVTSRGYYQWNPHLDCSVDVFEVNDLSELARKESDAEKRSRIYEQIVNLYDGRLLPQSASEPWVESVSVRLHGQYRTAILNLLELCKKWGESTRIVTLCTRALELDPYEERLYLEKIVALETLGRHEVRTAGSGGNGRGQSNPALCRRGKHPHRLENLSIHPATARRRVPNQHGWEPVPSPPCSSPAPRGLSLLVWVAGRLPFPYYYLSPLGAGSGSFFIWWAFPP